MAEEATKAARAKIRVGIKQGTDTYVYFSVSSSIYKDLLASLGLTNCDDSTFKGSLEAINANKSNLRTRLAVQYKDGTKMKAGRLFCATDSLKKAFDGLVGKKYGTGTISRVYIPRKLTYT